MVYLVAAGALLLLARQRALRGQERLEQARAELGPPELLDGTGESRLAVAGEDFDTAQRLAGNPLLAPIRILPVVGRQVRSVDALAGSARDAMEIGRAALSQARAITGAGLPTGPDRITLLEDLSAVAGEAARRLRTLDLGPPDGLLAPLHRARTRVADELNGLVDGLERGHVAAAGLARVLAGPSTYLLLAANNAEMRAGSGMFLSVGLVTITDGRLAVGDLLPVFDVPVPAGVPIDDVDFAARWGWLTPSQEWRNLGMTPRFDVSAALAARMWSAAGHPPVDGVLAVDVVALRALLTATGPVTVEGESLAAEQVLPLLLHDQYLTADVNDPQTERRERLAAVARAVVGQLEASGVDAPVLGQQLRDAAAGRHLLAWAADSAAQAAWIAAGVAGELRGESLLIAVLNRGANKLDQYLHVEAAITHEGSDEGIDVQIDLVLRNNAPPGEVPYIAGLGSDGVGPGDYPGFLSVVVPRVATDLAIEGAGEISVGGGDGPTSRMGAVTVVVPIGSAVELSVRFRLPSGFGRLRVEPSARVPPVLWQAGDVRWTDDIGSHTVQLADR